MGEFGGSGLNSGLDRVAVNLFLRCSPNEFLVVVGHASQIANQGLKRAISIVMFVFLRILEWSFVRFTLGRVAIFQGPRGSRKKNSYFLDSRV